MKTRYSQRGLSSLGWLTVLLVAGFFLTCAFRLGPAYTDNIYVRDALGSLTDFENSERGYAEMSDRDIRTHLSNYFSMNGVRGTPTKSVRIERKSDRVLVNINYEVRVPMFFNIDAVMTFKNQFDTLRPSECCTPQSE
ncbi:DUF4845 domain-containing protein [Gilvimarinus sp. F26214L]|uniref:DUF4845 domain-containing protein n=1 Tax=Gilvimarinus sp. DZF01 TaxID=3461371 RepID=UPI00404537D7